MGNGDGRPDATPLAEVLASFEAEGYRGQMAARPGGFVICFSCHQEIDAAEMELDHLERVEGVSDPADMLAVAAVTCPVCRTQGTVVLGYGPDSDADDAEVLVRLSPDG